MHQRLKDMRAAAAADEKIRRALAARAALDAATAGRKRRSATTIRLDQRHATEKQPDGESFSGAMARIAEEHGLTVDSIRGRRRHYDLMAARVEIAWLGFYRFGVPTTSIGRLMGGRDHTTIVNTKNTGDMVFRHRLGIEGAAALARSDEERRDAIIAYYQEITEQSRARYQARPTAQRRQRPSAWEAPRAELRRQLALLGIEGAPIRELAKALGVSATKTRTLVAELRAEGTVS